jgi:carbon starvation protein
MLPLLFITSLLLFALAFRFYGRWLERRFEVDDRHPTPAHTDSDGVDRVPAPSPVLLGHHFSSIAGAGPIVGPIIAATAFGWLPALLWVVIGAVFIGGVHDYAALMASIRHKARSVAEIAREYMSPLAYRLMLVFIWLSLVYVLVVFTDLTAETFVESGPVSTASSIYLLLAIGFGLCLYKLKLRVWTASLIFVPAVFAGIWVGHLLPLDVTGVSARLGLDPATFWGLVLLLYCLVASTTPVWILLQPRDYLSSYLLYASVAAGVVGILFGALPVAWPAHRAWSDDHLGTLFPVLFITVACGACSGFHSLVASGTTSKQLNKESDARVVGYGAMLIEGLVAVIALSTVIMLAPGDEMAGKAPLLVYGNGIARFLSLFGIPHEVGISMGLLALSTFILTSLDTGTRLARYIVEEFFNFSGTIARYLATLVCLILPALFILMPLHDARGNPIPAWKAIWPVFGATNQLMAGLALLVVVVWLKRRGKSNLFVFLPMLFMTAMTIWALLLLVGQYGLSSIGVIAWVLLSLAAVLIWEAGRVLLGGVPA